MKRRVVICTSAKGGLPFWWFDAYAKLLALNHPDYVFELSVEAGNSAINISRNIMADHAIRTEADVMVQIDTDMKWYPEALLQMLAHNEPIVCAPYVKKQSGPIRWLVVRKKGAFPDERGLCDMDFFGTGMFLVSVPALRAMCAAFPERRFTYEDDDAHGGITSRTMTELFPIGIVGPNTPEGRLARITSAMRSGGTDAERLWDIEQILNVIHPGESRMLGEDFFFSHLARKAGFKIWCDSRLLIRHIGAAPFPILDEQLSTVTPLPESNLNLDAY
jgi:hypothetical protein